MGDQTTHRSLPETSGKLALKRTVLKSESPISLANLVSKVRVPVRQGQCAPQTVAAALGRGLLCPRGVQKGQFPARRAVSLAHVFSDDCQRRRPQNPSLLPRINNNFNSLHAIKIRLFVFLMPAQTWLP